MSLDIDRMLHLPADSRDGALARLIQTYKRCVAKGHQTMTTRTDRFGIVLAELHASRKVVEAVRMAVLPDYEWERTGLRQALAELEGSSVE